jgi:2-polyprenyl-3-methyl-5-hydroxy-6-metoxy-1,4-benzoquinol methylase
VAIDGGYQYRALREGRAPQRFWHWAKLSEASRLLAVRPGHRVLDVGCGSGLLAASLARQRGTQVTGIDINESAIAFARSKFRRPNLDFQLGLVDELKIADGSVDRIAFLEVIEHITPRQGVEVLRGFRRLLRPGGRVVVTTPNGASPWPLVEWSLDFFGLVPQLAGEQHVALYNRWSLERTARRAGLRLADYRTINLVAPWVSAVSWPLARGLHAIERARPFPFGSILVFALERDCDAK